MKGKLKGKEISEGGIKMILDEGKLWEEAGRTEEGKIPKSNRMKEGERDVKIK